jgi:hypothetical protein
MSVRFFLVTYDRIEDRVVKDLSEEELKHVTAYCVQKKVPKRIPNGVNILNEWELNWNDFDYQQKQYYEYGAIVHLTKNPNLTENLSHIGLLHWDVRFNKDSINNIVNDIKSDPNVLYYENILNGHLYLSEMEVINLCDFMSEKMNVIVDPGIPLTRGWLSHSLSIVPVDIFTKFGKFLIDYKTDIEDILLKNRWGIMNIYNHKICGIIERMWGFYLMSQNVNFKKMDIDHESAFYEHKHLRETNWIKL